MIGARADALAFGKTAVLRGPKRPRQPFEPIPSGEIADERLRFALIRPLEIVFRDRHGVASYVETDRAAVALARLREAAYLGQEVTHFAHGGLEADAESLAALNCYLRSARAMRRMKLPFDRLNTSPDHRFRWAEFCAHLGLNFR